MLRQIVSITLVVSFIAISVSGIMMLILNSFAFQLQMHPVHKIFGIVMVLAGCLHVYLNFNPIKTYLKNKRILILTVILSLFLIFLFVVGLNKPVDQDKVDQIEQMMSQMAPKQ